MKGNYLPKTEYRCFLHRNTIFNVVNSEREDEDKPTTDKEIYNKYRGSNYFKLFFSPIFMFHDLHKVSVI